MQGAQELYDKFNDFLGNNKKLDTGDQLGLAASGVGAAGGLGLAGNSLYDLHNLSNTANNPVAITYGYSKGKGQGHKSIAEAYAKILGQHGVAAEPVTHGFTPMRSSRFSAVIPAGYGPALDGDMPSISTATDYAPGATKPLPFTIASPLGAENAAQRADRLRELAKTYNLPDSVKNIITLSGGESGSAMQRKLQALLDSTSHRQDTAILALAANAPDEVKDALAAMSKDRVRVVGALPKDDFLRHLSSSSLNVGYGGSNSVTEQLSMRNPQINMFIDKALNPVNTNNIDFASRYGGVEAFGVKDTDALRARIDAILSDPDRFDRTPFVNRHIKEVNSVKDDFVNRVSALRNASIGKRMKIPLRMTAGGLGLAAAGGLGLNYFMNKQSAFMSAFNEEDNGSKLKNLLGGAALGVGTIFMPAALPMLRIGARNQLAGLARSKSIPKVLQQFANKHKGNSADFLADYTEGARRLGDIPGMRKAVDGWYSYKQKHVPESSSGPSHDFQKSHFKRFMSGSNREGLKHWSWEVGQDFENKAMNAAAAKRGLSPAQFRQLKEVDPAEYAKNLEAQSTSRPWYSPSGPHKRLERGRQAIFNPGGLFDDSVHKGMSEYEAIKALGNSTDSSVQSFLRALALHKQKPAKSYVTKAMAAPALALGGAGAIAYTPKEPDSFLNKLRSSFSS